MFHITTKDLDIAYKLNFNTPNDLYTIHCHDFYELILFIKGECIFHVEGNSRHLKGGDIILIQPNEHHFADVDHSIDYERFVLKFSPSILTDNLRKRAQDCSHFFEKNIFFDSIIKQLDYYSRQFNDEEMAYLCKCKIYELILLLSYATKILRQREEDQDSIISKTIDYILNHLSEDITIEKIAKHLGLSESYIRAKFKESMNVSLMKYVRAKKCFLAKEMILEGKKPSLVAKELNFHDYSTFYRDYVKCNGNTPNHDYSIAK
jgi:AraC-like DNA-binding protein